MALQKGHLDREPQLTAGDRLKKRIADVVWELVVEGVYSPGGDHVNPTLARLRTSDYGRKCFEVGDAMSHDPDQYLDQLRTQCPGIDPTTTIYLSEALVSFRARSNLATAVMVGVAAEHTLLRLVDAVRSALDTPDKQEQFDEVTRGKKAKTQHDEIMKRLRSPATPFPPDLTAALDLHVSGIYNLIRQTQNDARHPTGRKLDRNETRALLLLFPSYCQTAYQLLDWLGGNKI